MDYLIKYSRLYWYYIASCNVYRSNAWYGTRTYFNIWRISEKFSKSKCIFISDIHRRAISNSLIEQVKGRVDLCNYWWWFSGKRCPLSKISANIQKLRAIAPVYFVWGNNDYEIEYHELDALLLENNVKVLDNTRVVFESELGEKICLLGVDDVGLERDRLDLALADCKEEGFRILISHNPDIINKMSEKNKFHLC